MKSYDPLRLNRAFALDKDTFCVVFSGKDYEDMYSYILVYEGQLEQPWSRSDVPRKVDGLTGKIGADGRPVIYALSDEGDVYTLPMGQDSSHRKIEGLASIPTMQPDLDMSTPRRSLAMPCSLPAITPSYIA
jgi:hypothetical protein